MFLFVYVFFLHFLADFVFQSREMGEKKSTNFNYLMVHVAIQLVTVFLGLMQVVDPVKAYQIASVNAFIHGLIDLFIWRLYKYDVARRLKNHYQDNEEGMEFASIHWEYWKDKAFYTTIGFDQFLHYSTIVLVCWLFL